MRTFLAILVIFVLAALLLAGGLVLLGRLAERQDGRLPVDVALSGGGAWEPIPGFAAIKRCPGCKETLLEGEEVCHSCGRGPLDDLSWRLVL